MSSRDVSLAVEYPSSPTRKNVPSSHFSSTTQHSAPSDDLSEFLWLRDETKAAMHISCDRETVRKLYNSLQEIEACIASLQRTDCL